MGSPRRCWLGGVVNHRHRRKRYPLISHASSKETCCLSDNDASESLQCSFIFTHNVMIIMKTLDIYKTTTAKRLKHTTKQKIWYGTIYSRDERKRHNPMNHPYIQHPL